MYSISTNKDHPQINQKLAKGLDSLQVKLAFNNA